MKLAISCTTYERPNETLALIKEIFRQLEFYGYEAEILVVNDGSLRSYKQIEKTLEESPYRTKYDRFIWNQGKERHWRIVTHVFDWVKKTEFDYAIYLQDDLILDRDFLKVVCERFESIRERHKVCLNYVIEESRNGVQCWTPGQPRIHRFRGVRLWKVGWVELHFIANRQFFEALDYRVYPVSRSRWLRDPTLSSGVGRQISWRLYKKGKGMWQVTSSLADHGVYDSKMNPIEREKNKLRSV